MTWIRWRDIVVLNLTSHLWGLHYHWSFSCFLLEAQPVDQSHEAGNLKNCEFPPWVFVSSFRVVGHQRWVHELVYLVILIFEIAIGSDHWCDNSPTGVFSRFLKKWVIFPWWFSYALFKKMAGLCSHRLRDSLVRILSCLDTQRGWLLYRSLFSLQVWSFLLQEPRVTWPQTAAVSFWQLTPFFDFSPWRPGIFQWITGRWTGGWFDATKVDPLWCSKCQWIRLQGWCGWRFLMLATKTFVEFGCGRGRWSFFGIHYCKM